MEIKLDYKNSGHAVHLKWAKDTKKQVEYSLLNLLGIQAATIMIKFINIWSKQNLFTSLFVENFSQAVTQSSIASVRISSFISEYWKNCMKGNIKASCNRVIQTKNVHYYYYNSCTTILTVRFNSPLTHPNQRVTMQPFIIISSTFLCCTTFLIFCHGISS